jgi:hypothetical protein
MLLKLCLLLVSVLNLIKRSTTKKKTTHTILQIQVVNKVLTTFFNHFNHSFYKTLVFYSYLRILIYTLW